MARDAVGDVIASAITKQRLSHDPPYNKTSASMNGHAKSPARTYSPLPYQVDRLSPGPHDAGSLPDHHLGALSLHLTSRLSTLPPTPPSQEGEHSDEAIMSPSSLSDAYTDAWASPRMNVSTPIHLTSPPTPDTTPLSKHRQRLRLPKPDLSSYPSQAESFVTARETLRSRSSNHSPSYMSAYSASLSAQSSRQRFSSLEGTIFPNVPASVKRSQAGQDVLRSNMAIEADHVGHGIGADLDRTVSDLKSTQPPPLREQNDSPTPRNLKSHTRAAGDTLLLPDGGKSPTRKPRHRSRGRSKRDQPAISTESMRRSPMEIDSSHDALYSHIIDEKSKRLSSNSNSSAIVEAMVYSSPPKPRQNLRHAGKNLALRNDVHKSATTLYPGPTSKHPLRHHKESLPSRAIGAGQQDPAENAHQSGTTSGLTPTESHNSQRFSDQATTARHGRIEKRRLASNQASPNKIQSNSAQPIVERKSRNGHKDIQPISWRKQHDGEEPMPSYMTAEAIPRERMDSLQDEKANYFPPISKHFAAGDGHITAGDGLSPSLTHRASCGQNSADHHASPHFPTPTPVSERSMWSERTHYAEVNDATAVSIYPHNNESVLLVQQRRSDPTAQGSKPPNLKVILDTGTPPSGEARSVGSLDSPSMLHPRTAPQPPSFKFIPPTPNDEVDRQLNALEDDDVEPFSMNATTALPQRRSSIRARARAHSTALVDAILFRQPSVRTRRRSHISRRRTIGATADEYRPRNLHPFWKPRGFWDDFDSDDEDDMDPADHEDHDRLPAGGDTSDVEGPDATDRKAMFPRKMSKRLPGFRGSGGFLVGNSLGLGRHGTNSRRPHISLPLGRGGEDVGSKPAPIRKRRSEHALRMLGAGRDTFSPSASKRAGVAGVRRSFGRSTVLSRLHVFGMRGLRDRVRGLGEKRLEWLAEKRRDRLRGSIGGPLI